VVVTIAASGCFPVHYGKDVRSAQELNNDPNDPARSTRMVVVPSGAFRMGCDPGIEPTCDPDEMPQHEVQLGAFAIDRNEVTELNYNACVRAGQCSAPTCNSVPEHLTDKPVTCVEWEQASTFCTWLHKRLPTEAEWEKAARGTDGRIYPWGNQPPNCSMANFAGCNSAGSQAAAMRPRSSSPYGALDMAGNVWEWVSDWYDADYYTESPRRDPQGPRTGAMRIARGGDYLSTPRGALRTSHRGPRSPVDSGANVGFRCVRAVIEKR
jgi:formylglycine-generating enzyme required for sulfatase activity